MSRETFPTNWCPSAATQASVTPRVLRAVFGDGYEQAMPDGINAYLRIWEVTFDPIHASNTTPDLYNLNLFFERNAGRRFDWTQPKPFDVEGPQVFECETWTWTYQQGLIVGVHATFKQKPDT